MREEQKLQYPPDQRTPVDRSLSNTKLYADEILKIADEWKRQYEGTPMGDRLEVVDTFNGIIRAAGGDGYDYEAMRPFFSDGLHLTPKAYEVVFNASMEIIKSKFNGLDPDDQTSLPMTIPQ